VLTYDPASVSAEAYRQAAAEFDQRHLDLSDSAKSVDKPMSVVDSQGISTQVIHNDEQEVRA